MLVWQSLTWSLRDCCALAWLQPSVTDVSTDEQQNRHTPGWLERSHSSSTSQHAPEHRALGSEVGVQSGVGGWVLPDKETQINIERNPDTDQTETDRQLTRGSCSGRRDVTSVLLRRTWSPAENQMVYLQTVQRTKHTSKKWLTGRCAYLPTVCRRAGVWTLCPGTPDTWKCPHCDLPNSSWLAAHHLKGHSGSDWVCWDTFCKLRSGHAPNTHQRIRNGTCKCTGKQQHGS